MTGAAHASGHGAIHAVAVALAVDPDGPLAGVLILGGSGSGKSSLALALIESCPYRRTALIADDVVFIAGEKDGLIASPAKNGAGLIEIRGFGPARVRAAPGTRIAVAIDLDAGGERVPEPSWHRPSGPLSGAPLYPFVWKGAEATAAARLRRIAAAILGGQFPEAPQDAQSGKGAIRS